MIGRTKKYSLEFQQAAVERMKESAKVAELARDLRVRRKWLYGWRIKLDPEWADRGLEIGEPQPAEGAAEQRKQTAALQNRVKQLERLTAQQALDLSFFKAASQELEKLRRANKKLVAMPSTPQPKT